MTIRVLRRPSKAFRAKYGHLMGDPPQSPADEPKALSAPLQEPERQEITVHKIIQGTPGAEGQPGAPGIGIEEFEEIGRDLLIWLSNRDGYRINNFKGKDGEPGRDGVSIRGREGKRGLGVADVQVIDGDLVTILEDGKVLNSGKLPHGEDGVSVERLELSDGKLKVHFSNGSVDQIGRLRDGRDGIDGVSVRRSWIDDRGRLIFRYSNNRTEVVGQVRGKDGEDGKPGDPGPPGETLKANHGGVEDFEYSEQRRSFRYRKNGRWSEWIRISRGGGGGIEEAPTDGKQYGRQNGEWTEVTGGAATVQTNYTLKGDGSEGDKLGVIRPVFLKTVDEDITIEEDTVLFATDIFINDGDLILTEENADLYVL